ncbi:MAG: hypothetical protein BWY75_03475 [bacterium ADurb.Bin425]|nr:MAG: hypothetical protein BWY75_03475 [bacterium ADurb.Bin425]
MPDSALAVLLVPITKVGSGFEGERRLINFAGFEVFSVDCCFIFHQPGAG